MTTRPSSTCIIVLGMHRSGTSALTGAISLMGAALPRTLMPRAQNNNEAGFWEPRNLVALHEQMLAEAGSQWDDWRAFDPSALGATRRRHYENEIGRLIAEEYQRAPLFVIKDPRICRFVPLYEAALAEAGVATRFVLPQRNPLAVIASLAARDGITKGFAGLIWLRHVLDSEAATRGRPRIFVSYESFLNDWRGTVSDIGKTLGIEWPREIEAAGRDIAAQITRNLQHHAPQLTDLEHDTQVAGWIKEAYAAVLKLAERESAADALANLDRLRAEFDTSASVFGQATFPELAMRDRRHSEHERKAAALAAENARLLHRLSEREQHAAALAAENAGLAHRLSEQEQRATALAAEIAAIRASRLFRFGRLARRAWIKPGQSAFLAGSRIALLPAHDLGASKIDDSSTEWSIAGIDPQFELKWPSGVPLPKGHYRLSIDVPNGIDLLADAHLYIDSGRGYNDDERLGLTNRSADEQRFSADFSLPTGTYRLRLDPAGRPGTFVTGAASLRRLSRVEFYGRIALKAVRRYRSAGGTLPRGARTALAIVRRDGVRALAAKLYQIDRPTSISYSQWIMRFDALTQTDIAALRRKINALAAPPLISVVMPVFDPPENLLAEAIESVRAQIYDNWELCIADDRSTKPQIREILEAHAASDPRIKVVYRTANGHISRATNSAFGMARGEWIALLDHDDLLPPNALAEVALEIGRNPEAQLIYSDEDKLNAAGERYDPYFKPEFSRELFRSQNYLNHLTVHRAENIRAVGGWRPGFEGGQDYDLNLRIVERIDPKTIRHIPKILYHWRAVTGSTASAGSEKDYAYRAGLRALEEHVVRLRLPARVQEAPGTPFYRVRFSVPRPPPLVSLVIPTRDMVHLLRGCIESIRSNTTYSNYEIIVVDNGSREAETLAYFDEMTKAGIIRVLPYDKPFNYSAINNFAVEAARGEIIGLVNNDIVVISPDWLTEMVSWAIQPDIGCVGAKLYYGNDTIQHAGVIMGLGGVAGHSHKHFPRNHPGYFYRLKVLQNISAVTGACLVVRREIYRQVGGLNETDLTVAFNDVDFCFRVRRAGYLNVWTPYAELYHLESLSRGAEDEPDKLDRFRDEIGYMREAWHTETAIDPYYSPNLTRAQENFALLHPTEG